MMVKIDYYFKRGKYRKNRIWRNISAFKNKNENFIGRVFAEILNVYEISECPIITLEE